MEYILSALWLTLELVFFHLFWSSFFSYKVSRPHFLLAFAGLWIISIIYTHLSLDITIKQCVSFFIHLISMRQLYDGRSWQHIVAIVMAMVSGMLFDVLIVYGTCAILEISYSEFVWKILLYSVVGTLSKLLAVLSAWVMYQVRKNNTLAFLQRKWILLSLLFPAVSYAMLIVVFHGYQDKSDLSIGAFSFSCVLAIANVANLYLINMLVRSEQELHESILLKQQMEIQTESMLALERNYRNQRKAVHEFKHQLQTINDLLLNEDIDAAQEYVQYLEGMQSTRILAVNSHHPIIDAVLNHKYQIAKDHQIDVQIQVNDLSGVNIKTDSIVVLLSNLWDNAIEACSRVPNNSTIQCSMLLSDGLYICIRNTSLPVRIINNTIPTTKKPSYNHGHGLPIIQHILKQHEAEYTFSYNENWFEFAAEIPIICN